MKARVLCVLGFLFSLLLITTVSRAQCPSEADVQIFASGESTFKEGQGVLTFSFKQPLFSPVNRKQYRVRLYEKNSQRYIYDDNNPPFQNKVKIFIVKGSELRFEALGIGDYALEIHGQECQHQRFNVPAQSLSKNN